MQEPDFLFSLSSLKSGQCKLNVKCLEKVSQMSHYFRSIFHFCNIKALLCCTASFFSLTVFICFNLCSQRGNKNEIKICWTLQIHKICATFYFTNKFSYKIFLIKLQCVSLCLQHSLFCCFISSLFVLFLTWIPFVCFKTFAVCCIKIHE